MTVSSPLGVFVSDRGALSLTVFALMSVLRSVIRYQPIGDSPHTPPAPFRTYAHAYVTQIIHEIPKAVFVDGCYQKNCKVCCPCLFW